MGYTIDQIKVILHDIKDSWYFRFWATAWIGFAILGFVCFLILVGFSRRAAYEDDSRIWFQDEQQIYYPRFHFRCSTLETILSINCTLNNQTVTTTYCQESGGVLPNIDHCVAVNSDKLMVINRHEDDFHPHQRIVCEILTNGTNLGNSLIAWELEIQGNEGVYGVNVYTTPWIYPTARAWVMLEQAQIQQVGQSSPQTSWNRNLLYHSTVSVPGQYHVDTMISSFHIMHVVASDSYNGWNAMGDIGGFAFFMVIVHTFVSILIGLCFVNNSEWLRRKSNPAAEMKEKSALLH